MDQDLTEALRRIEAKLDALTQWSGWHDMNGRLITEVEWRAKQESDRLTRAEQVARYPLLAE